MGIVVELEQGVTRSGWPVSDILRYGRPGLMVLGEELSAAYVRLFSLVVSGGLR